MATVLTELARELRSFAAVASGADGAPPFAVVGGLAVSARTEPRFTRDVDVAVAVANEAAAEARSPLRRCERWPMLSRHTDARPPPQARASTPDRRGFRRETPIPRRETAHNRRGDLAPQAL